MHGCARFLVSVKILFGNTGKPCMRRRGGVCGGGGLTGADCCSFLPLLSLQHNDDTHQLVNVEEGLEIVGRGEGDGGAVPLHRLP